MTTPDFDCAVNVAALCAGYGGLELGLALTGVDVNITWYAETDPHASKVMAFRYPDALNLGDITEITNPPQADIVTAGFPCQPVSRAGNQKGIHDERWLINDICAISRRAGAYRLILENVAGLLTTNSGDAFSRVLSALAYNGFDARWTCVRASDVGAPHQRLRWFLVANANMSGRGEQRRTVPIQPKFFAVERFSDLAARFGPYADAIARWELVVGRPSPEPVSHKDFLNPKFVEWMMGLPEGHVTDVVDSRNLALKILGNGVVPQQAAYALQLLESYDNHK